MKCRKLNMTPSMYCFISSSIDGNSCFSKFVQAVVIVDIISHPRTDARELVEHFDGQNWMQTTRSWPILYRKRLETIQRLQRTSFVATKNAECVQFFVGSKLVTYNLTHDKICRWFASGRKEKAHCENMIIV